MNIQSTKNFQTGVRQFACALLLVAALGSLAGCKGSGGGDSVALPAGYAGPTTLEVRVADVTGMPIAGAVVTVTWAGTEYSKSTTANGSAAFPDLQAGHVTLSVSAAGFEDLDEIGHELSGGAPTKYWNVTLRATGHWAVGHAIVLGTHVVDRASNGSALRFSVDMAVIGENSEAIDTLTAAEFSVVTIDCGWGGPRDCASDAAGNATGAGGNFSAIGGALAFGWQPAPARHPYVVGVLFPRSPHFSDWGTSALKSFFGALGGNDFASLASVETVSGIAMFLPLGPFTSDGHSYMEIIDGLASPADSQPAMLDSFIEYIHRVAAADVGENPGAERTVLVTGGPAISVAEIGEATSLARQLGIHISYVGSNNYDFPEMAVRTGGFVAEYSDERQIGAIFSAMDQLLSGSMSYYRMQFLLNGDPGTFVAGGNAKVRLRIRVPTAIPHNGVIATFDVAIP